MVVGTVGGGYRVHGGGEGGAGYWVVYRVLGTGTGTGARVPLPGPQYHSLGHSTIAWATVPGLTVP